MKYVSMIVVGLVVGILARFIYPGAVPMGLILSAVLGVVGSFLAGFVGSMVDKEPGTQLKPAGFVYSILGALVVIFIARFAGVA
ncbi:GlsB/YeaQ/YmgE family stress response membrane protein [Novosphingobium sp.]|uniref:GlsB/YeaQ/YmgE family stress response membrane protein n=1 Tax=Novosphingobium sp. TaxID=1874826 RepID=UPI00286AE351|nr:GlsB/YeaQ/YmgE family stress response membrane protein [Novosphingobium sp.]